MSRTERPRPSAKVDRTIAWVIWTFVGTLAGVSIGVFTGYGWLFLVIGLVVGLLLGWRRTKPVPQIEED